MSIRLDGKFIALRPISRSDAEDIYKNAKDKEISRFTFIPHPYTMDDAFRFIKLSRKHERQGTSYHFGIELKATGRIIGMIGVHGVNSKHKRAELGYFVGRKYWGKGFAGEALRLVLSFGFNRLRLKRMVAGVMHPNVMSSRLLERAGFTLEGRNRKHFKQHGRWLDEMRYGILREEYRLRESRSLAASRK
ncbi:MAG TPA: GNAT family N-acetyltransferase [Candidatus Deferrimicrobium sp.]|nr:GNAT family N-acetyltransferase [Candidatus Deferrimicrobium sp.]